MAFGAHLKRGGEFLTLWIENLWDSFQEYHLLCTGMLLYFSLIPANSHALGVSLTPAG